MHSVPGNPGGPGDGAPRLIAGRYRLGNQIGRGAMGIVWHGRDELLERDVAVKEIQIASHAFADVIHQRALREARTAARLSHPSVATVFDVVEQDDSLWIVMELVDARSLDRVVIEDGPLPPLAAAELGISLLSALSTAHAAGVLHRDIKPSNVMVTSEGKAVLTDFGIATFAAEPGVTQAGMVVGTPGFTAPERVRGEPATPASDLWSVGATLYAAVEGRGPFERAGGSTIITAGVASEDAPRAPSAGPLGPVIDALLSRDPADRPDAATAARLLSDAANAARAGASAAAPLAAAGPAGAADSQDPATSGPDSPTAPSPAGDPRSESSRPASAAAAFLDPPVFAELVMPEFPGLDDVAAPGPAGSAAGAVPAGTRDPAAGPGPAGVPAGSAAVVAVRADPGAESEGPRPGTHASAGKGNGPWAAARGAMLSSGRWRLMVAAAGIAAIAIAAIIGWGVYNSSPSVRSPQGIEKLAGAGPSGSSGSSHATGATHSSGTAHGSGGTPAPGTSSPASGSHSHSPGGSKPKPGHSASGTPTTHPSTGASESTSAKPSPSQSSTASPTPTTSASTSPTSSPSPSPSPTPVLPAGYKWHVFTAATMGTAAGFKIGVPDAYTQSIDGMVAHLNRSARNFHIEVNLAAWKYAKSLREAQYLEKQASSHNDFKVLLLESIGFKSVAYRSGAAAELKFSWVNATTGVAFTQLDILVTLSTASGDQPYTFIVWAPSATFSAASGTFHTALKTFRVLPA